MLVNNFGGNQNQLKQYHKIRKIRINQLNKCEKIRIKYEKLMRIYDKEWKLYEKYHALLRQKEQSRLTF